MNPTTHSTSSPDFGAIAERYARDVVALRVPAGRYVRRAALRHLDDIERSQSPTWPYEFDVDRGAKVCRFISALPHTKGRWAAKGERLDLTKSPWQCFLVVVGFGWMRKSNGKRRFREFYWEIPRKNGKALEISTPVATTNGWKAHGDLEPGDYVFGPDGQPVEVEAVTGHYSGPCMAVSIGQETIVAHERHEWVTERTYFTGRSRGHRDKRPLPAVETRRLGETLTTGGARDDFVHRIQVAKPIWMPHATLPIHPYVVGAWLGDGNSASGNITFADDEIRDRIIECGETCRAMSKKGAATYYSLSDGERTQSARNRSVAARLRRLGILGAKRIPATYQFASIEQRTELLRGLIDTDGHITKRGQVEITSMAPALASDIVDLVASLGMKPSVSVGRATIDGRDVGEKVRIQFFAPEGLVLAYVKRKADRQRRLARDGVRQRSMGRTVTAVEPVGERVVNCVQVRGGLYLAGRHLVTTHNSLIAAGIGLYMLAADGEFGGEVYSGATSEKQALEVFRPARLMAMNTPRLTQRLGVEVWAKSIVVEAKGSLFAPIIGNPGDGASPSCAIVDEYHEHQTSNLYDTMITGMGAREQPLALVITTAGTNIAGPCYDKHDEVTKVLDGVFENDHLFGVIFGIDETDDWADPKTLVKANPNYGVSIDPEFLQSQQRAAMASPIQQTAFKTKHLNVWCSVLNGWMNMQTWGKNARPLMDEDELAESEKWFALDLASKSDLCSEQRLYRRLEDDGDLGMRMHYYLFGRYWLPEAAIELEGPNQAHYKKWVTMGLLTQTDGATVDFKLITETIIDDCKRLNPLEVVYDPFNATQMAQALMEVEITCVEFTQTPQNFAVPMDELESALKDGRFHHDGNEITTWCFSNVVGRPSKKGLLAPTKQKAHQKIDGGVAAIMAMARAAAPHEDTAPQLFFV